MLTNVENEAALVVQAQAGDEDAFAGVIAEENKAMMAARWKREPSGGEESRLASFERLLLPHLDGAYNLARWITGHDQEAEDLVQEACLRALKSFDGFRGGDGRSWLMTIVRNTCYTWLQQNRSHELTTAFDEQIHNPQHEAPSPEALLLQRADSELVKNGLQELALDFREVLILRELEGLSYKEIATVAGIPIGTVMSRLARGRAQLSRYVSNSCRRQNDECSSEVGFVSSRAAAPSR
ncbi:MAG TPA: sigma-70 family RNA polymerase sigma factor [Terriglobia bacterium]|nr:sigma-70 family RNA polymerase sigma factor [Terriglobia bacterium]